MHFQSTVVTNNDCQLVYDLAWKCKAAKYTCYVCYHVNSKNIVIFMFVSPDFSCLIKYIYIMKACHWKVIKVSMIAFIYIVAFYKVWLLKLFYLLWIWVTNFLSKFIYHIAENFGGKIFWWTDQQKLVNNILANVRTRLYHPHNSK